MLKFPSQCVVTAEAVMWNKDMSKALQNGSLRELSELRHVFVFFFISLFCFKFLLTYNRDIYHRIYLFFFPHKE